MPVEHFKSRQAYKKNLAYRHIHNIPFTAKKVVVGGKEHAVKHTKGGDRAKIDAAQRRKVARRQKSGFTSTRRGNQHFESETHSYHF